MGAFQSNADIIDVLDDSTNKWPVLELEKQISVFTYDEDKPEIKVLVLGETVSADLLLRKVAKALDMKASSLKHFGICEGLHTPIKKYKCSDRIKTNSKGLSLQKWCFDLKLEKQDIVNDPVALYLTCLQARSQIMQGILNPSPEQSTKLEDHNEPGFLDSLSYMSVCHCMEDYMTAYFKHCELRKELLIGSLKLPTGTKFTLRASKRGMRLQVYTKEYFISWRKIKRWTKAEDDLYVTYELYSVTHDSSSTLVIETPQAPYLVAVTIEMIKTLQAEMNGMIFQTSDLRIGENGEVVEWNNITFDPRQFNAETEEARRYTDLATLA
ncbi:uncharacterized protein [Diadema antillarum]|uniref:uncharacterized protein n=1 Tax=Diadema antillarum TaxID=105358 RepID=UPI003A83AB98